MDVLIVLAVLPAALLFILVYKHDSGSKESPALIAKLFLLGCVAAPIAAALETFGGYVLEAVNLETSYGSTVYDLVTYLLVVGVAEELSKFLFLATTIDDDRFNYTFDGVLYAVAIGLGFATLENIMYVVGTWSVVTAVARGLLSVPLHCTCAVFMGYFFGLARKAYVRRDMGSVVGYCALSLFVPIMIHGVYDFAIENEIAWIAAFGFAFTVAVFVLAFIRLKKASVENELLNVSEPPFTRF